MADWVTNETAWVMNEIAWSPITARSIRAIYGDFKIIPEISGSPETNVAISAQAELISKIQGNPEIVKK